MSADYPRMLFHRKRDPVTVQSEEEEAALGSEWSRKIFPKTEEPEEKRDPPDQEEEGENGQHPDEPEFDDPAETPADDKAPASKRAPSRRKKR